MIFSYLFSPLLFHTTQHNMTTVRYPYPLTRLATDDDNAFLQTASEDELKATCLGCTHCRPGQLTRQYAMTWTCALGRELNGMTLFPLPKLPNLPKWNIKVKIFDPFLIYFYTTQQQHNMSTELFEEIIFEADTPTQNDDDDDEYFQFLQDKHDVEDEEDEDSNSSHVPHPFILFHTRDHHVCFQDRDEFATYLLEYCTLGHHNLMSFEYEPMTVPPGTKCQLAFRTIEPMIEYLMKSSSCQIVTLSS